METSSSKERSLIYLRRLKMLFLLEFLSAVLKPMRSRAFSSSSCCCRLFSDFLSGTLPRSSVPAAGFRRSFSFIIYSVMHKTVQQYFQGRFMLLRLNELKQSTLKDKLKKYFTELNRYRNIFLEHTHTCLIPSSLLSATVPERSYYLYICYHVKRTWLQLYGLLAYLESFWDMACTSSQIYRLSNGAINFCKDSRRQRRHSVLCSVYVCSCSVGKHLFQSCQGQYMVWCVASTTAYEVNKYLCYKCFAAVPFHSHGEVQPCPGVVMVLQTRQDQVQVLPVHAALFSLETWN